MASVKVAVRVRPFNRREESLSSELIVSMSGNQVTLTPPPPSSNEKTSVLSGDRIKPHKFSFDFSYWSHNPADQHFVKQEKVFQDLGTDVVDNAFSGYNACVFAYGQTGSGKTYTMMGTEEDRGLIPRICQTLFKKMEGNQEGTTYRTEVSYLEIYNERVKDLLRANSTHNLKVREHPKTGPYVQELSKHLVMDYSDILELMKRGNNVRTTASTNMNDTSSRSHAIFTITFVSAGFYEGLPRETVSKIHLVDLAGSERADATGATGQRLKEGAHINKSLVTLGSVISALAEASSNTSQRQVFIPYRDSVLTWLLKDSLGGNSKTIMIATISPAGINHGETLSTLRYANRAKNIINKPTVNEDPNVKLIRELRAEIDRLRCMVTVDGGPATQNVREQLAEKEAKERHLTEEWTEKWKEAANILKEQRALALKRTGLGVVLDSDKPHLVGIDEDVLSTGITLYHLKEGETVIGSSEMTPPPDIVLKGPAIEDHHCVILLDDGIATLTPSPNALCLVNAMSVSEPTRLWQGCVVILGRTNMFRYNDPHEAAKMRKNLSEHRLIVNQSLLSQSLSDLRIDKKNEAKMYSSEGDIKEEDGLEMAAGETAEEKGSSSQSQSRNFCSTPVVEKTKVTSNLCDTLEDISPVSSDKFESRLTTPSQESLMTTSQESHNEHMSKIYDEICDQKNTIMNCLESENCDINTLNEQMGKLRDLQTQYAKLEFEATRNLWIGTHHLDDEDSKDFEEKFSVLVEQEVERRLFQERILKAESEFQEREMLRMEQEHQINQLRRQHEREIYLLKRKLHEGPRAGQAAESEAVFPIFLSIPKFVMTGVGSNSHVEYQVTIFVEGNSHGSIYRRFRRFRDLHVAMSQKYSAVQDLSFPSRRLFGNRSEQVSFERQKQLQSYLNSLVQTCAKVPRSPLFSNRTPAGLVELSSFFEQTEADRNT